eukprot:gene11390-biopygen8420
MRAFALCAFLLAADAQADDIPTKCAQVDTQSDRMCSKVLAHFDQRNGRLLQTLHGKTNDQCCDACLKNKDCEVWVRDNTQSDWGTCYLVKDCIGDTCCRPGW